MSEGRNLDEELEAQLSGAAIPEDDVEFENETEDLFRSNTTEPAPPHQLSPDWALVDSTGAGRSSSSEAQGKSTGKKFSICLLHPGDGLCMKIVGDGSSFCLVVGCTTNHAGNAPPLKLENPTVVILKNKERAFGDLTLEGSLVPPEVLERWEATTRPLSDWHEAFLAVQHQNDASIEGEEDFGSRVLEVRRAETFKTPGKRRTSDTSVLDSFVPYPAALRSTTTKDQLKRNPHNFGKLGETIVALDDGLFGLAGSFQSLVVETREASTELAETSKMLALKISRTNNLVGSLDVMKDSEYASPTVWSSLACMGADVQTLLKRKVQLPTVDLKPLEAQVATVSKETTMASNKLKSQVVDLATALGARIGKMERAVTRLNTKSNGPSMDNGFEAALRSAAGEQDQGMEGRVKELETMLKEMDIKLRQLQSDNEDETINFGGLGLRNEEDMAAWIVIHFSEMHYALISDCYGILESIEDEGPANQSDFLRDMKKRDDLSINGMAEGQALTAHLHEIPRIFHSPAGKDVGLSSTETHLSRIPSYKHWSTGSHCLRRKIETGLVKVRQSNRLVIQKHFKSGTLAYSIACEALDKSVTWITGLISFIERTYDSLHGASKFTAPQAWSLTSQLVRRIFSDLHNARMGTTRAMGKDRVVICTTLLWSAFKTHDAMAAFENANFEDHPSISSEYVKFLAMNSGFEAIEEITHKIKVTEGLVKELQSSAKQADKKAENAVSYCETHKKLLNDLTKRLTTQEAKK